MIRSKKFSNGSASSSGGWCRLCTFRISSAANKNKNCNNAYILMIPLNMIYNATISITCGKSSSTNGFDIGKMGAYFISCANMNFQTNIFKSTKVGFKISEDGYTCDVYYMSIGRFTDNSFVTLLSKSVESIDPSIELNPDYTPNIDESTFNRVVTVYNNINTNFTSYIPYPKGTKMYGDWIKVMNIKSYTGGETSCCCEFVYSPSNYISIIFCVTARCGIDGNFITSTTNAYIIDKDAIKAYTNTIIPSYIIENLKVGFIQENGNNPLQLGIYIHKIGNAPYLLNPYLNVLSFITDNQNATTWYEPDIQDTELTDSDMGKIVEIYPTTT